MGCVSGRALRRSRHLNLNPRLTCDSVRSPFLTNCVTSLLKVLPRRSMHNEHVSVCVCVIQITLLHVIAPNRIHPSIWPIQIHGGWIHVN